MVPRKRRTRQHVIADLSVNHVERLALHCGYSVERVVHDYGIDLAIYTYEEDGEAESGHILVQVKATDNLPLLADRETIPWVVSRADLARWLRETMPCILVVYDARAEVAYWLYLQAYFQRLGRRGPWEDTETITVHLSTTRPLDLAAIRRLAQFRDRVLAQVREVVHGDT